MSLSSASYAQCRNILLQFDEFESFEALKLVFTISELADYGLGLPDGKTKAGRVDVTMTYLLGKHNQGQSVFTIFLRELASRQPEGADSRKDLLLFIEANLADVVSTQSQPLPTRKTTRWPRWVIIIVVVTLLVGVSIIIWFSINNLKQPLLEKLPLYAGPATPINSITYSPDGKYLVVAATPPMLQIWKLDKQDLTHSQLAEELAGDTGQHFIGIRKNYKSNALAAISSADKFRVWMLDGNGLPQLQPSLTISFTTSYAHSISLNPDSTVLAASGYNNSIDLWDLKNGQLLKNFGKQITIIWRLAFSPTNSNLLASAGDDKVIKFWDVSAGTAHQLVGHTRGIEALEFSSDGHLLASGDNGGTLIIWDVDTEQSLRKIADNPKGIKVVTLSPDGRFVASGNNDSTIKIWEVSSGSLLATLNTNGIVSAMEFSPNLSDRILVFGTNNPEAVVTFWHWS
jgi:WD40 repeat protein